MGKATNKREDSIRLSSLYYSNSANTDSLKRYVKPNYDVISMECNKPLRSNWSNGINASVGKKNFELGYNSDKHYVVYHAVGDLWLCRDRKLSSISDCEREQIKLYNRLKREYEREQKMLQDKEVSETVVTAEDKARARARKVSYFMNKEYYDRIYKAV